MNSSASFWRWFWVVVIAVPIAVFIVWANITNPRQFVSTLLNGVSAKLTTDNVLSLNKMVDIDHQDPADVAKTFLNEQGLLSTPTTTGNGKTLTVGVSGAFSESTWQMGRKPASVSWKIAPCSRSGGRRTMSR